MPLVSGTIPNMINGVSQQPATVRNPSQAEEQINFLSTAARGLRKRPSSNLIARPSIGLTLSGKENVACHAYKRNETEQYHLMVDGESGTIRATNLLDGVTITATNPYLVTPNASRDIRFLSVADTTFLLNKGKVVEQSATFTHPYADLSTGGLVYTNPYLSDLYLVVAIGNYGKKYRVDITFQDSSTIWAEYTTPDGGSAADSNSISTDFIATQLYNALYNQIVTVGLKANMDVRRYGSVIHILTGAYASPPANQRIRGFQIEDGYAGTALRGFNQLIDDFSLLPTRASRFSAPVKIKEGTSKDNLGYYVRFESQDADGSSGIWQETVSLYEDPDAGYKAPQRGTTRLRRGFNHGTMPLALVNVGVNAFNLGSKVWGDRLVGDIDSAKDPSFVGKTIEGMFFHRNRLGFVSESAVSLSEADNFFNFYPTTVIQVLDTDRIDVQANTTVIDTLHSAVPFDSDLIIFGDRTQYKLSGEPLLTPKTVEMKLITSYDNDRQLEPVSLGSRVLFGTTRGDYTTVRELYITNDERLDAPLITAQVPEYLPKDMRFLSGSTADDMIVMCPKEEDALYVHSFYNAGNERLMSSWSRWEFNNPSVGRLFHPIHAAFLGSKLVVTFYTNNIVLVADMDLSLAPDPRLGPFKTSHLDLAFTYTPDMMTFDGVETRVPAIGGHYQERMRALIVDKASGKGGQEIAIGVDIPASEFVFEGDVTGYEGVRIGSAFDAVYELSTFYMKQGKQGGPQVSDTLSRLMVRRMELVHEDTSRFTVEVTPEGRSTRSTPFPSAAYVATQQYAGFYPYKPEDGVFRFSVNTKNIGTKIVIKDTSPYPINLLSATWEAQYVRHSKGVS